MSSPTYNYGNFIVDRNCDRLISDILDKLEENNLLTDEVKEVVQSMYSSSQKAKEIKRAKSHFLSNTSFIEKSKQLEIAIFKRNLNEKKQQDIMCDEMFCMSSSV